MAILPASPGGGRRYFADTDCCSLLAVPILSRANRAPTRPGISAYYIVVEALINAAKHSGAAAITVTVERDRAHGALRLKIADTEFIDALSSSIRLAAPRGFIR